MVENQQNEQVENKSLTHDFDRLVDGLKRALSDFQTEQTPENFAVIVTALSEFGISGADIWRRAADYSKRYPLRSAVVAGLAFFAFKGLLGHRIAPRIAQATAGGETGQADLH